MTLGQAFLPFGRFAISFAAGAMLVGGLTLRLWWGTWGGVGQGAAVSFISGIILTLLALLINFAEEL
jgi:hypothetical protein